VEAHTILGQKGVLTRDYANAAAELEKVIALDPAAVGAYSTLGAVYMAAGQPSEAERVYRKGTELNPKSVDAHIALAEFYFSQRKLAEAEAATRTACDLGPSSVLARLILGRTLAAEGRMADAERVYTALKGVAPNDPKAYQALALFYLGTDQKLKALAEFRALSATQPKDIQMKARLIETLVDLHRVGEAAPLVRALLDQLAKERNIGPGDPRLLLAYGRVLIAEGKFTEAIATLQKVTSAEPKSAEGQYYLGVAQKAAGQPALARASFVRALELAPEMSLAAAALAGLEVRNGNREEAVKRANRAIESNPSLAQGYVAKGRALLASGDTVHGTAALEEALTHDPVNLAALAALLKLSIGQGKTADSVKRIDALLKANPESAGLHFLLALGTLSMHDLDRAEANARQAMALDPATPQIWTLMANIDFARHRPEEGKADLRKAIAASPQSVSNYTALGTQYEKEKNWEEAKKLFEKAYELDRNSPFVAAELAFLYLEHNGDVNVALSLAQTARRELPHSPVTADALGWAYYRLGSADLAVKELEESVQMIPGNPVYQYHLGMAYASARRWDKAERLLRAALSEDSNFPYASTARAALDRIGSQAKINR
jgi:Flp pilus assembly protein TadD